MTDKNDWRQFSEVRKLTAEHEKSVEGVRQFEAKQRELLASLRAAERVQQTADDLLIAGKGSGAESNRARLDVARAKRELEAHNARAETVYDAFTATESALQQATDKAKATTWPALLREYVALGDELDQALAVAVEKNEMVTALHQRLIELYAGPGTSGHWVAGPGGLPAGVHYVWDTATDRERFDRLAALARGVRRRQHGRQGARAGRTGERRAAPAGT